MMRSLALAALAASAVALAPPGAPRTLKTRRQAAVAEPDAKAKVSSANAKRQVGNDAFLNKDLRARARGGTGVVNDAKLKIGIVGAGLAGMVCAMDLADAGHEVEIFELRPFVGGKVSSWKDKEGNHIEMGLHVFFGCYYNLFGIMERTGSYDLLRMKEHIHTFVNKGGELGALDFRFPVGAPVSGLQAFARTEQLGWGDKAANALRLGTSPIVRALVDFDGGMDMVRDLDDITFTEWFTSFGGSRGSIDRMWDPIAYALGFIDCDHISARCMLTIFMLFAIRTEASVLRMLDGSPQTYLHDPIVKYLEERGVKINLRTGIRDIVYETDASGKPCKVTGLQVQSELKEFDAVVAAVDLPGAKKLIPEPFRVYPEFDRIYELDAVPIATVQLRFDGSCAASLVIVRSRRWRLHETITSPRRRRRGPERVYASRESRGPPSTRLTFQQRRLGHGAARSRQNEGHDGRLERRPRPRHRQSIILSGRRVLVLRGSCVNVPGRVLQGRGRVFDAVRHGLEGLWEKRSADRARYARPDPHALPLVEAADDDVEQRGQVRSELVPRKAGPGQVPPVPGDADPELLPGRVVHVPGLHRLDGGRY